VEWRLLEGVTAEEVRLLLSVARRRTFARNEVVFHRHDPADSLHLIAEGRFAVRVMTPLGESVTLALRGPGESFGEMALVGRGGGVRSATVVALEPAETFAVYRDDFHRLRDEHPAINEMLLEFLAAEVRLLDERLLEALYVPVERRVLRRLTELVLLYGDSEGPVEVPLTQEALAGLAGASRGALNRVLRREAQRGTVELRRGKTVVLDRDELARRAR
jgi:CRP/FNR family transcriptional regulator, cyclic AMP receptor protein